MSNIVTGFTVFVTNITERKLVEDALQKSEEKYRNLIDSTPDLRYRTDMEGRIVFISQSINKLSGYTVKEAVGMNIVEKMFSNPEERKLFLATLQKNDSVTDFESQMKRKDGSIWWASTNAHFFKSDDSSIHGVEGVTRDITERKFAETEKNKLESLLKQAQKMEAIGTLAGGIAHDFNNILSPIMGYSEMLREDLPQDSPNQESITRILQAALRARDLVKQILTFSHQSDQELKPIKLQPILKEALKLLGSSIPKTIDIQTDIDPNCGVVVADHTQIHQIIMNLATNAYHAMQDSGGKLMISLVQAEIESMYLRGAEFIPGKYALLKVID
ncbi:MAG: PAS domain S-box protein, partial [Bacteroidetes bacterium]|nr:PAS domain S-box protein [Bacteroidota bacterium]